MNFRSLTLLLVLPCCFSIVSGENLSDSDWKYAGHSPDYSRFSTLDQIKKENVGQLQRAWSYHTGNNSDELKTTIECNPLVLDGVMYVTSPVLEVIALNAETGKEIWRYDPFTGDHSIYTRTFYKVGLFALLGLAILVPALYIRRRPRMVIFASFYFPALLAAAWGGARVLPHILPSVMDEERRSGPNRGLTYWEDGSDKRLFFAGGHHLVALNPQTGQPIESFGNRGAVDLTKGLSRNIDGLLYAVTSPGVIYKNLIMLSARVGEGPAPAAPGDIRAFDVRTGEQKWTFHTIPHPGETGYDTWPTDAWKRVGGANAWGGMTIDTARGIVYAPIGSATFDFYGGDRPGKNLFSDCLIALRADTGTLVWYYQMVHHDIWDYDLASPPNLVAIQHEGRTVDAVVEALKNGFVFVLDRDTGKPIFPVEERPVPPSTLPGEQAWPTQPYPLKPPPLARQEITENDLTDLTPEAHAYVLRKFRQATSAKVFVPPNKQGTLITPGFRGGSNWSGASYHPPTGRLVFNTNEFPYFFRIVDAKPFRRYRFGFEGFDPFVDPQGYPGVKPPWGRLTEIDMNTGDIVWQVPLGEYKELTARGIPQTGAENAGGSIITAGGLIFIGATKDKMFRAFDLDTGKILWETSLDAAAHAMPCTYAIHGKQYVVIAAGGGSVIGSSSGDEYVAFALPN